MAAAVVGGVWSWEAGRDEDGFRTYKITHLVKADVADGPVTIMNAVGLPTIGSTFSLAGFTGSDPWCWCSPKMSVRVHQPVEGDPSAYYQVEQEFNNNAENGRNRRCNNTPIEDPLLEPMKVSGSFNRSQWEARYDRNGYRLVSSANEPLIGAATTFDYVKPTVRIEQNVASLGLSTFSTMVNTVNGSILWGCPVRTIKLTNAPWSRKVYGTCNFYYTRTFEFEVDFYNQDKNGNIIGHDREVADSGSMCLRGTWITDSSSSFYGMWKDLSSVHTTTPATVGTVGQEQFAAYKSMDNEHCKVALDGYGRPANASLVPIGFSGAPATKVCQYYRESNFLLLGIPTTF